MNKINHTLLADYKDIIQKIDDRLLVIKTMGADEDYIKKTEGLIKDKEDLRDHISDYYDKKLFGRVGKYETVSEFMERMNNTLEVDENGQVIEKYYKLGIKAIDDEFFHGKGVFHNSLISIGADSAVGKTTLALNIISSLAIQGVKSQFYSFEMGDRQFFNEISEKAKNKLNKIINSEYANNLTLDFHSRDITDLANSIQMRNDEGVEAFVIDSYLSIYAGADEFRKMKEVVDMLATLKKELGILIIIIAQISKSDSFNDVYDFHGGNTLKYESDVALFIRLVDGEEETTKRHIHCEKNRIFEDKTKFGIITEYDLKTHTIKKLALFKEYGGKDANGKELKKLKFGRKK